MLSLRTGIIIGLLLLLAGAAGLYHAATRDPWAAVIATLTQQAPPAAGSVLFLGTSSLRLWDTLAADMAPVQVHNNAVAGAHSRDVLRHFQTLVPPGDYAAIVLYLGENDLASRWRAPAATRGLYLTVLDRLRRAHPATPVVMLAFKPSPRRARRQAEHDYFNRYLAYLAARDPQLYYLDTARALLDNGRIQPAYYSDGLHLSAAGYARWRDVLRPLLLQLTAKYAENHAVSQARPAQQP